MVDNGRVVTVPTVGVVVVNVVVDDNAGFQISNLQNPGSRIGLDSGSSRKMSSTHAYTHFPSDLLQNSVPLATPKHKEKDLKRFSFEKKYCSHHCLK